VDTETRFTVQGYAVVYRPPGKSLLPYEVTAPDGTKLHVGTTWHSVERAIRMDGIGIRAPSGKGSPDESPPNVEQAAWMHEEDDVL